MPKRSYDPIIINARRQFELETAVALAAEHGIHASPLRTHPRRSESGIDEIQLSQVQYLIRYLWGGVVNGRCAAH